MTLEWLRRHDPALDRHLRTYLFTSSSVLEVEAGAEANDGSGGGGDREGTAGSLGIGSLKGDRR